MISKKRCSNCPYYVNHNVEKLVFSLYYVVEGKYSLDSCSTEDKLAFLDQMRLLSHRTWEEVISAHRHGVGSEKIEQSSIKQTIPNYITPDTKLLALRFSGKKPMVGFRDKNIFYPVWFDVDFKLYNHG